MNFYIILVKLKLNEDEDEDIIGDVFFPVKSMYDGLTCNEAGSSYKAPFRSKKFWILAHCSISFVFGN